MPVCGSSVRNKESVPVCPNIAHGVNDIETFEEDEEEGHSFSDQNTGEPSNSGFGALQDHDYLATSPSTEEQLNAAQKEIV
ncbi:hypothetical protein QQF64_020461 [Cirrhinus molitorella]|uniref:Uncharacterized protein n=1 Tax=Cirrhinus molitorella TaxID=172907 RepID=A0ABR3L974_9TELE